MTEITKTLRELQEAIVRGKKNAIEPLIRQALSESVQPEVLMDEIMIPAMDIVGEQFAKGEIYLPEMMIAARAMNSGLETLRPILLSKGTPNKGQVVIGTVKGDFHDVGKNIVALILKGAGYEVVDLGTDVAPEQFTEAVKKQATRFVLMSALITSTMSMMAETIKALQREGLREKVKVGVGGAPLTESFAGRIGADFYGKDARDAVIKCHAFTI